MQRLADLSARGKQREPQERISPGVVRCKGPEEQEELLPHWSEQLSQGGLGWDEPFEASGRPWVVCVFCFTVFPIHSCLHTEDVKSPVCHSEWALDLLWGLMSLVRYVVVSLSVMDCLYPRDPLQPVRKKRRDPR